VGRRFASDRRSKVLVAFAVTGAALVTSGLAIAGTLPASKIPKVARASYDGYQFTAPLLTNPYASWKPPSGPVKFCLNESYEGNIWRQQVLAQYKRLVGQYAKAGLAKPGLQATNSNNNAALQITQYNSLVAAGCQVIFSSPASTTALCPAFAKGRAKGMLNITSDTGVKCPDVINVGFNAYLAEKQGAVAVAKALKGKGNVLLVTGIPGTPTEVTLEQAVKDGLAAYPDIKVVGQVAGNWTPSVAQTAVAQFLSTHPDKVDGIIDFGEMGVAAGRALQQAGRPLAKTNSPTGECPAFAYAHENPGVESLITSLDPRASAYEAFLVAAKMLKGAKPFSNNIMYQIPSVTPDQVSKWYKPSMTTTSSCYAQSPSKRAVPDSYFTPLFKGGKPIKPLIP
jgi:ribose transport system substrate-binding protein